MTDWHERCQCGHPYSAHYRMGGGYASECRTLTSFGGECSCGVFTPVYTPAQRAAMEAYRVACETMRAPAMLCEHANEVPLHCRCAPTCECWSGSCRLCLVCRHPLHRHDARRGCQAREVDASGNSDTCNCAGSGRPMGTDWSAFNIGVTARPQPLCVCGHLKSHHKPSGPCTSVIVGKGYCECSCFDDVDEPDAPAARGIRLREDE